MEQTRQIRGGISTLGGVRFEIMAVLYELPDLLEGRLNSVRYQPLSSAVSPGQPSAIVYVDDYSVEEENGHKRYAQVKQNTRSANWTINNLLAEGVIKQFWDQHQTDLESSLLFVSDKPATQLKNLADYSRSAISAEEFLSKATQRVKGDADDIIKSLDISIDELWEMLKVTDCILRTEQTVSDRLVDYATDRYSVAEKFALVLKDFVERSPGMQLTKDLIVRELEEKGLFRLPVSVSQDTGAILHTSSGALRNYRSDILGLHIDRKETSLLESWIVESSDERPVAFLLDVAGSGKSVIMHDLLEKLEKNNVPVLGVKADVLGSIRSISDLQAALGLPDSTESILSAAAINGKAVLLIDQLDALSFNLARDQETLDTIIGLIGRASSIAGIYVIVSCRAFDRKFDPKLRQIHSSREFTIQPLKDSEIQLVLSSLGLDYEGLSPREQELLSNPHHLDLFATTISETLKRDAPRHSVTSVQQLYDLLWDLKINSSPTPNLSSFQLRDAIYGLVDLIDETQELFQPVQVFDEMHEAKDYLESAGIFKREGNRLGFFHQSFFDYCYARRFLDQEKSLGESIKKGDQGFFVRPQVIQTLNYLRDINNPRCVEELKVLTDGALIHEWMRRLKAKPGKARLLAFKFLSHAASPPVRYHMRILVFAWFGQLRNLTDAEKEFGRTRLNSHYDLHPFLLGAQGNEEWFDVIQSRLPELLSMPEDNVDVDIMPFLRSVEENRPREVFGVLSNQLGQSREWSSRVVWCLNSHKAWESSEAEECLLWVCENTEEPWYSLDLALYNVGKANPNVAARALKVVLERLRQQMEAEPPSIEEEYLSSQTAVEDQDAAVAAAMARSRKSEDHLRKLLPGK